jgi:anhydro-N-acetylmuramic acid kinase
VSSYYIGLMSGNSLDAMDAVLVCFTNDAYALIAQYREPIPAAFRSRVQAFSIANEVRHWLQLDAELAEFAIDAVHGVLAKAALPASAIAAIGLHGQTLCHFPDGHPWTLQVGNPHRVAAATGIDVIADFRRRDIIEGGQGAPLAPLLHQFAFAAQQSPRYVVNIGGIANVSVLDAGGAFIAGFDTGPGNILLDGYMQQYQQQSYDDEGAFSAHGSLHSGVLDAMLAADFFQQPPPKSTGREQFNLSWAMPFFAASTEPADIMQTLTHLTARSIAEAIRRFPLTGSIFLCGGGAYNTHLRSCIGHYLDETVETTATLGLEPDVVEAVTFAYLAFLHCQGKRVSMQAITGAKRPYRLGIYCPA